MKKNISYLNIPTFPIALERIQDSELKECELAIAPLSSDRAKIWAVSKEAKEAGISKGMTVATAKRLCRSLHLIHPNPDLYKQVNRKLERAILKLLPVYEFEREGKAFLDLTGFHHVYGTPEDFSLRLKKNIKEDFSLECSFGNACNKLVSKTAAKVASDDVSDHILSINEGREASFLEPMVVDVLPVVQGLKKKRTTHTQDIFEDLNLHYVKDLTQLDRFHLTIAFGPQKAELIHQMARGIDPREVHPPKHEPIIFEETHLEKETNNIFSLVREMEALVEKACHRLRAIDQYATRLTLSFRYSDFRFVEKNKTFELPFQYSHQVLKDCRRMINHMIVRRTTIRYISFELGGLTKNEIQMDFFDHFDDRKNPRQIEETLDQIKEKFGSDILLRTNKSA